MPGVGRKAGPSALHESAVDVDQPEPEDLEPLQAVIPKETQVVCPQPRRFWQWLEATSVEKIELWTSVRFGKNISDFLRAWLPYCRQLKSHPSARTAS